MATTIVEGNAFVEREEEREKEKEEEEEKKVKQAKAKAKGKAKPKAKPKAKAKAKPKTPTKKKGKEEESEKEEEEKKEEKKKPSKNTSSEGTRRYATRQQSALSNVKSVVAANKAKRVSYVTQEGMDKYVKQLKMVFRVLQKSGKDKEMNKDDVYQCLLSLGKKSPQALCTRIMKEAANEKGLVDEAAFVKFMVARKNIKVSGKAKKKEEKSEEEEPKKPARKASPKKASPKKAAPKKTPSPKKTRKADKTEEPASAAATAAAPAAAAAAPPKVLARGLSLTDFFTEHAGLQEEIQTEQLDTFGNPLPREFDLGLESAFSQFGIIMYSFYKGHDVFAEPLKALQGKGFRTFLAKTEEEFIEELPKFDEAWFASDKTNPPLHDTKKFADAIKKFHENSGGLFILAENDPFFVQANEVLKDLLGITLVDNTNGGNILTVSQTPKPASGTFCKHLITTGLVNLYEGITICRPDHVTDEITVIGTSSNHNPCFFCVDFRGTSGRIVVNCGFTNIIPKYWDKTAGTGRLIRNVAVWLTGLDHRLKIGAPVTGPITTAATTTTSETPAAPEAPAAPASAPAPPAAPAPAEVPVPEEKAAQPSEMESAPPTTKP